MNKKIIITIICVGVGISLIFGGKYLSDLSKYKNIIADIEIRTPDLSQIQDGEYNGSFDAIIVAADVDVTVLDNRITGIVINEHKTERGSKAEVITDEVIVQQSLDVDTVSGATNSSKVILKAIENALVSEAM
jgi:uncharacterized protein with FMN-binding domain